MGTPQSSSPGHSSWYTTPRSPISWLIAEFAAANTASNAPVLREHNQRRHLRRVPDQQLCVHDTSLYRLQRFCYAALRLKFAGGAVHSEALIAQGHLDPRSALHDPVGAWVGSLMVGHVSCRHPCRQLRWRRRSEDHSSIFSRQVRVRLVVRLLPTLFTAAERKGG
jgi:hypothetical protein